MATSFSADKFHFDFENDELAIKTSFEIIIADFHS